MSTAGSGKRNSLAHLGTITLNVFDVKVTKKRSGYDAGAIRLGQPSEIGEKELKGRDVTHQATYANPILLIVQEKWLIDGKLW